MMGSSPCSGRTVGERLQSPHGSVHKLKRKAWEQCRAGATQRGGGAHSPHCAGPSQRQRWASGSSARVSFPAVNSSIFPHGMAEAAVTASPPLHRVPTSSAMRVSHALEQRSSRCWGSGFPEKSCLKHDLEAFCSFNPYFTNCCLTKNPSFFGFTQNIITK